MFRKAGTFPCTAAGAPSCPLQSLSEPCPVSLIPNLIGFQGDVTGVSPGARITCSVLLTAVCHVQQKQQDTAQSLSVPRDVFTHSLSLVLQLIPE